MHTVFHYLFIDVLYLFCFITVEDHRRLESIMMKVSGRGEACSLEYDGAARPVLNVPMVCLPKKTCTRASRQVLFDHQHNLSIQDRAVQHS
jgi:hypothetical protein